MAEKPLDGIGRNILDTARTLIEQFGVEKVSMYQVAQTAGVGQGTLYRRYPSKAALCQILMDSEFSRFIDVADAYLREAAAEPVETRIVELLTMMIKLAGRDVELLKSMVAASRARDAGCSLNELRPFLYVRDTIRRLLEEAASQGTLAEAADIDFAATVVASTFTPELIVQLRQMGYTCEEIALRYRDSFLRSLFAG